MCTFVPIKVILNPVKDPTIKAVSELSRDFNCMTAVTSNKLYLFALLHDDATDHLHSPSQSGRFHFLLRIKRNLRAQQY